MFPRLALNSCLYLQRGQDYAQFIKYYFSLFFFFFFLVVLRIEHSVWHMLGIHTITELHITRLSTFLLGVGASQSTTKKCKISIVQYFKIHLRKLCVCERELYIYICVLCLSALPLLCRPDKKSYIECLPYKCSFLLFSAFSSSLNSGIFRAYSLRKLTQ